VGPGQAGDRPHHRHRPAGERDRSLGALETGDRLFQVQVGLGGAGHEAGAHRRADPVLADDPGRFGADLGVHRQAEIVVGAELEELAAIGAGPGSGIVGRRNLGEQAHGQLPFLRIQQFRTVEELLALVENIAHGLLPRSRVAEGSRRACWLTDRFSARGAPTQYNLRSLPVPTCPKSRNRGRIRHFPPWILWRPRARGMMNRGPGGLSQRRQSQPPRVPLGEAPRGTG